MKFDYAKIMGDGYISYDEYREFRRMLEAFDELMKIIRPTLHRYFNTRELIHLADMRDFLFCVYVDHKDNNRSLPVYDSLSIATETHRDSTYQQVCAATLKLIDRALVAQTGNVNYPHSYSELADFCRWQWLNHDREVD